jgi:hypothetical protein
MEDWKEAYEWLMEKALDFYDNAICFDKALQEILDEATYEQIASMASQNLAADNQKENEGLPAAMKEMFTYGYQKKDVIPVPVESAQSLFQKGWEVWLLMPDNTEKLASDITKIEKHYRNGGMFGVAVAELETRMESQEVNK